MSTFLSKLVPRRVGAGYNVWITKSWEYYDLYGREGSELYALRPELGCFILPTSMLRAGGMRDPILLSKTAITKQVRYQVPRANGIPNWACIQGQIRGVNIQQQQRPRLYMRRAVPSCMHVPRARAGPADAKNSSRAVS